MRINLLMNGNNILSGYVNVDQLDMKSPKVYAAYDKLDDVAVAGEAEEVRAIDILGYFNLARIEPAIAHWASRLAHSGRLIIGDWNSETVVRLFNEKKMDYGQFSKIVYGEQSAPWQFKKSMISWGQVVALMQKYGLIITRKELEDGKFIVEGTRP